VISKEARQAIHSGLDALRHDLSHEKLPLSLPASEMEDLSPIGAPSNPGP